MYAVKLGATRPQRRFIAVSQTVAATALSHVVYLKFCQIGKTFDG